MSPLPLSPESYPALTIPLAAPGADSANNVTTNDVVGNKTDTIAGNSLYSLLHRAEHDRHNMMGVFPTQAAGSALVSNNANWTYGGITEIMAAASAPAGDYHITRVVVEATNKAGVFELALYYGAADTLFATVRYAVITALASAGIVLPITGPVITGGSRIRAQLASSDGFANQATQAISLGWTLEG